MSNKKYTQDVFDAVKDPARKEFYGDLGTMYQLFIDLTETRKKKGLTQKQVSEKSGITQPVLARIEAGRTNPSLSLLVKILTTLDCKLTISAIAEGEDML